MFESNFSKKEKNKVEHQECARSFESVVRLRVANAVRVFLDVPGIFSIDLRLLSENSVCAATHSFMVMHRGVRPPPTPSVLSASCGIMAASVACDSCMYVISDPAPVSCATSHTAAHVRPLMLDKCLFMYCMRAHVRACLEMRLKTFD